MMIDYITIDIESAEYAGHYAGQYLEKIGKTDMATLTRDEWINFLLVVVGKYRNFENRFEL